MGSFFIGFLLGLLTFFFCYRLPFTEGDENSFPSSLLVLNLKKILILLKKNHGFDLKLKIIIIIIIIIIMVNIIIIIIYYYYHHH
jgi:hypothetical protein